MMGDYVKAQDGGVFFHKYVLLVIAVVLLLVIFFLCRRKEGLVTSYQWGLSPESAKIAHAGGTVQSPLRLHTTSDANVGDTRYNMMQPPVSDGQTAYAPVATENFTTGSLKPPTTSHNLYKQEVKREVAMGMAPKRASAMQLEREETFLEGDLQSKLGGG